MSAIMFAATEASVGQPTLLVSIAKAARGYVEELRDSSPRIFTGERLFNLQRRLSQAVDAAFDAEYATTEDDQPW